MDVKPFIKLIAIFLVLSLCLGSIYRYFSTWLQPAWLSVCLINTILALFIFIRPQKQPGELPSWLQRFSGFGPKRYLIPSAVIIIGATALSLTSYIIGGTPEGETTGPTFTTLSYQSLAAVLWVPVVEEIVFRRGFGQAFRSWAGEGWGLYFSAVFFAVAHAQPTFHFVLNEGIGLALGPLMLGLCVEILYTVSGYRLWPCILLHASCNLTPVIFYTLDPRWMEWLSMLYI